MAGKNQYVMPYGNGWAVRGANNHRVTSTPSHPGRGRAGGARNRRQPAQRSRHTSPEWRDS
jgi:hypothetical protein